MKRLILGVVLGLAGFTCYAEFGAPIDMEEVIEGKCNSIVGGNPALMQNCKEEVTNLMVISFKSGSNVVLCSKSKDKDNEEACDLKKASLILGMLELMNKHYEKVKLRK